MSLNEHFSEIINLVHKMPSEDTNKVLQAMTDYFNVAKDSNYTEDQKHLFVRLNYLNPDELTCLVDSIVTMIKDNRDG